MELEGDAYVGIEKDRDRIDVIKEEGGKTFVGRDEREKQEETRREKIEEKTTKKACEKKWRGE